MVNSKSIFQCDFNILMVILFYIKGLHICRSYLYLLIILNKMSLIPKLDDNYN
jgi:hypothetical protein